MSWILKEKKMFNRKMIIMLLMGVMNFFNYKKVKTEKNMKRETTKKNHLTAINKKSLNLKHEQKHKTKRIM